MSFAAESFAGTDGTALETYSSSWTKVSGGSGSAMNIDSGHIYAASNAGWQVWLYNAAQAASADYDVECTVYSASGDALGPCGRIVSSSNSNGYLVKYVSGTGWGLFRRNGTPAQRGSYYNGDAPTTARTVRLNMVGDTIKVYIDGVERISDTGDASAITTKGYAGVGSYYASAGATRWLDDWSASDPAASGYTLTADAGSFTESGTAAALGYGRVFVSGSGAFALSGTAAALKFNRSASAAGGEFVLGGQDATVIAHRLVGGESGGFDVSGTDAALNANRLISSAAGSFSLSGADAQFSHDTSGAYSMVAASGGFDVVGADAVPKWNRLLAIDSGSILLSGSDTALSFNRRADAESGSFGLSFSPAGLVSAHALAAGTGSFSINGIAATLSVFTVRAAQRVNSAFANIQRRPAASESRRSPQSSTGRRA